MDAEKFETSTIWIISHQNGHKLLISSLAKYYSVKNDFKKKAIKNCIALFKFSSIYLILNWKQHSSGSQKYLGYQYQLYQSPCDFETKLK